MAVFQSALHEHPLSSGQLFVFLVTMVSCCTKYQMEKPRNEELTSSKWWIVGSVRKSPSVPLHVNHPVKNINSVHHLPLVTWESVWLAHQLVQYNNALVQLTRTSLNKSLEEQE